jgi:hypothetical protein
VSNDNFTADQVNLSYALFLNTHTFFKELAEYIQHEQGKYDPVAIKLLEAAGALGKLTETDVIQLLYHAKEMYKNYESNGNTRKKRDKNHNDGVIIPQ